MHKYLCGLGSYLSSESLAESLPAQNSPQNPPFGLFAEQLSGSSFTMPRHSNLKAWLYRISPSVKQGNFTHKNKPKNLVTAPILAKTPPNQLRWNKVLLQDNSNFITSLSTLVATGCATALTGGAIHIYSANQSMEEFFYNADGELLIIPQDGELLLRTEFGELAVAPLEIAVIPRGIKFQVQLLTPNDSSGQATFRHYGYVCENYGAPFRLPDLGLVGANGLASARDFLVPSARYEDVVGDFELVCKFEGEFWTASINHSPLDVVAWHGNYFPYKYDLRKFNFIGSVSFDHADPSIATVLTSPTSTAGLANIDFAVFPPRWVVAEHTFRPPYFHRNVMSEYMGLITGHYDAKYEGFVPGGSSLHNRMSAHGPDSSSTIAAIKAQLAPKYVDNTMAFLLESSQTWRLTEFALTTDALQKDYLECWANIPKLFSHNTHDH